MIASKMTEWESLTPHLGITKPQAEAIRKSCHDFEMQKRESLIKWKQKMGDKATYKALITAAKEASNKQLEDAVNKAVLS